MLNNLAILSTIPSLALQITVSSRCFYGFFAFSIYLLQYAYTLISQSAISSICMQCLLALNLSSQTSGLHICYIMPHFANSVPFSLFLIELNDLSVDRIERPCFGIVRCAEVSRLFISSSFIRTVSEQFHNQRHYS